jgi:hypothetical protein
MVDTQLDSVVAFLAKAGTVSVKHIEDAGVPYAVATSGNKILVYTGRLVGSDEGILRYTEDYPCETDYDSETNLVTLKTTLIGNCDKVNRRVAISDYTKPATLINIRLVDWAPPNFNKTASRIRNNFTT